MLFDNLNPQDYFGFKILKNGYNPAHAAFNDDDESDPDD